MPEIYCPDFLKGDPEKAKDSKSWKLTNQYREKFGHLFSTEDKIMSKDEMNKAMEECIERGIEMDEYLGLGGNKGPDDEI